MMDFLTTEVGITVVILVLVLSLVLGATSLGNFRTPKRWDGKYRVIEKLTNDGDVTFAAQEKCEKGKWSTIKTSKSAGPCISLADKNYGNDFCEETVIVQ